jgi:hypothetical protein
MLVTPHLSKNDGGTFHFTGGKLHADNVHFDLTNDGGTIAPGSSIGHTQIDGNLLLNSGTLEIELASLAAFDSLHVDGTITPGGSINVVLLGGYAPSLGESWPILTTDAAILPGQFASVTDGFSIHQEDNVFRLYFGPGPVGLAGDFNDDGTVDAADYLVWRKGLGTIYTPDDYDDWQANFGATSSAANAAAGRFDAAVPEPAAWALILIAGGLLYRATVPRRSH